MARIYPQRPVDQSWTSEREVLKRLVDLDDRWIIFHSVAWQGNRRGRQADGEADFVLVHRTHGALVIEVKGGAIDIIDGTWYSTGRAGKFKIKNPFDQAKDSKYALLRFLDLVGQPVRGIPVCHAVAFPDAYCGESVGLYGPREIILDAIDLASPSEALLRVFHHWCQTGSVSAAAEKKLVDLLAPTHQFRRNLRVNVVDIRTQIDELTAQQVKVLDVLRGVRSARIEGSAGTGKTVLAVEKVRQLANGGFSVLLVCFNLLLAEHLKLQFDNVSAVTVTTFHALVYSLGRRAGVDFAKDPAASWWDVEAANVLVDAARKVGAEWDALVIDEGQDFHETWFPALQLLQRGEDPPLFVFADKQQAIYRPGCQLPKLPVYFLDENCRNQKLIAEKVAKIFDGPVVSRCGDGVQPLFAVAESETEIVGQIERWCERLLLEEELDPSQIVVLSDSRRIVEILRGRNVAEWSFIDYGKRGIVVETIHRFKGLEADAIIVSFAPDAWQNSPVARELAYVAFSRARGLLLVTGPARLQPLVRW